MATGPNTTLNIDDTVRPMLAESRYTMEFEPVMKQLCRPESLPKGQGGIFRYPKWGTLSDAQDLTQGIDITQSQRITDSLATITPTEVGQKVIITDRTIDTVTANMWKVIGKLMGDAMARKIDKDGITMLDGFSTILGGAGTALTHDYLAAGLSAIQGGSEPCPANVPVFGVFHPHQLHPLYKDQAPSGTYPIPAGLTADLIKRGAIDGVVGGVALKKDGNISKDSSDDAKGGIFAREALILVKDASPKSYKEHRGSLRGWEIIDSIWYAYGEYKDDWGREAVFDAVTPTS